MTRTAVLFTTAIGFLCSPKPATARTTAALTSPVKSVYDDYLRIQVDLANDSLKGVATEADAIAETVRGDRTKAIPRAVATQAESLAKASTLDQARAAFKPLSNSLIQYLASHNATGAYVEVYCPMTHASWLQADRNVNNPYLLQDMPTCGRIRN